MYDEQNVEENVKNALFSSTLYKMKNIFSFVFLLFFFSYIISVISLTARKISNSSAMTNNSYIPMHFKSNFCNYILFHCQSLAQHKSCIFSLHKKFYTPSNFRKGKICQLTLHSSVLYSTKSITVEKVTRWCKPLRILCKSFKNAKYK